MSKCREEKAFWDAIAKRLRELPAPEAGKREESTPAEEASEAPQPAADSRKASGDGKARFTMPAWLKLPAASAIGGGLALPNLQNAANMVRGAGALLNPWGGAVAGASSW